MTGNTLLGMTVNTTQPTSITFHQIEDKHLEVLMKTNSPISLNIATTSLGIFLGNLIP